MANCLAGLAGVMIATANHAAAVGRAVQLLGAAEALRDRLGVPLQVADRREWDRSTAAARAKLEEATVAAAWSQGRTLSLEQALTYAI